MEEESSPYCHNFNSSQSNSLPVDCTRDSSGNLAATSRLVRGRLTEPSKNSSIYEFCHSFSLVDFIT